MIFKALEILGSSVLFVSFLNKINPSCLLSHWKRCLTSECGVAVDAAQWRAGQMCVFVQCLYLKHISVDCAARQLAGTWQRVRGRGKKEAETLR